MPELPEVETIRRDLAAAVRGRRITGATLYQPLVLRHPTPTEFVSHLRGKTIEAIDRKAKYLLLRLSDDWLWVVHLMLEGQLLYQPAEAPIAGETKLIVSLDNGCQLRLRDVVGLARTYLLRGGEELPELHLWELGPEPLAPGFTFERFLERLRGRSGMIKPLLLDQHVIAGVGNLYADEVLFRARLHPKRKANTLTPEELSRLYEALIGVLQEAVAHRGTSAPRSLYRDLWGRKGGHQDYLQVFRKRGEPCPGCAGAVQEIRVGGRATFVCPSCQPVPSHAG